MASRNVEKLAEMERILREHLPQVSVLGLDDVAAYDEPVEDQPTFEGNALLKARAGVSATGLPTIADDSGLCVDALNGMPGVLSARWSGQAHDDAPFENARTARPQDEPFENARTSRPQDERNNRLLLDQLADVPAERRGAHFVCASAFVDTEGAEIVVEGRMPGRVVSDVRGDGGFGYDVIFEAADRPGLTTAELSRAEKDAISHRGKALREIAPLVARATDRFPE